METTDEELLRRYRSGDDAVADILLEKYKKLVRMKARELFLTGGDRDDLLQEGMLGLFRAIREYDETRDASFATYAQLLITRQMYTAVTASQRKKHQPLNSSLSISEMEEKHQETSLGIADSPEAIYLDQENARLLKEEIVERLSTMEKKVFAMYMDGMDYQEIALGLRKSPKSIDNALQRIRSKTSLLLREKKTSESS